MSLTKKDAQFKFIEASNPIKVTKAAGQIICGDNGELYYDNTQGSRISLNDSNLQIVNINDNYPDIMLPGTLIKNYDNDEALSQKIRAGNPNGIESIINEMKLTASSATLTLTAVNTAAALAVPNLFTYGYVATVTFYVKTGTSVMLYTSSSVSNGTITMASSTAASAVVATGAIVVAMDITLNDMPATLNNLQDSFILWTGWEFQFMPYVDIATGTTKFTSKVAAWDEGANALKQMFTSGKQTSVAASVLSANITAGTEGLYKITNTSTASITPTTSFTIPIAAGTYSSGDTVVIPLSRNVGTFTIVNSSGTALVSSSNCTIADGEDCKIVTLTAAVTIPNKVYVKYSLTCKYKDIFWVRRNKFDVIEVIKVSDTQIADIGDAASSTNSLATAGAVKKYVDSKVTEMEADINGVYKVKGAMTYQGMYEASSGTDGTNVGDVYNIYDVPDSSFSTGYGFTDADVMPAILHSKDYVSNMNVEETSILTSSSIQIADQKITFNANETNAASQGMLTEGSWILAMSNLQADCWFPLKLIKQDSANPLVWYAASFHLLSELFDKDTYSTALSEEGLKPDVAFVYWWQDHYSGSLIKDTVLSSQFNGEEKSVTYIAIKTNNESIQSGDNVVWTEDGWDKLSASVDLSKYATKDDISSLGTAIHYEGSFRTKGLIKSKAFVPSIGSMYNIKKGTTSVAAYYNLTQSKVGVTIKNILDSIVITDITSDTIGFKDVWSFGTQLNSYDSHVDMYVRLYDNTDSSILYDEDDNILFKFKPYSTNTTTPLGYYYFSGFKLEAATDFIYRGVVSLDTLQAAMDAGHELSISGVYFDIPDSYEGGNVVWTGFGFDLLAPTIETQTADVVESDNTLPVTSQAVKEYVDARTSSVYRFIGTYSVTDLPSLTSLEFGDVVNISESGTLSESTYICQQIVPQAVECTAQDDGSYIIKITLSAEMIEQLSKYSSETALVYSNNVGGSSIVSIDNNNSQIHVSTDYAVTSDDFRYIIIDCSYGIEVNAGDNLALTQFGWDKLASAVDLSNTQSKLTFINDLSNAEVNSTEVATAGVTKKYIDDTLSGSAVLMNIQGNTGFEKLNGFTEAITLNSTNKTYSINFSDDDVSYSHIKIRCGDYVLPDELFKQTLRMSLNLKCKDEDDNVSYLTTSYFYHPQDDDAVIWTGTLYPYFIWDFEVLGTDSIDGKLYYMHTTAEGSTDEYVLKTMGEDWGDFQLDDNIVELSIVGVTFTVKDESLNLELTAKQAANQMIFYGIPLITESEISDTSTSLMSMLREIWDTQESFKASNSILNTNGGVTTYTNYSDLPTSADAGATAAVTADGDLALRGMYMYINGSWNKLAFAGESLVDGDTVEVTIE